MESQQLAINGGKPVRAELLPYSKQWLDEEDVQAVVDVLNGDYLTTGPTLRQFETEIARYVGSTYAVAFSSGTAALHGACFAAGITSDSEVITSPMTFAASANCVMYTGGTPVFTDIDSHTYNIDPDSIERMINGKTRAIIPIHFTGQPADMDPIRELADKHQLIIIEDAAHALGAAYHEKRIGSIGDMTMFSFHPLKQITTGEGGIITTSEKSYYEKLIQFRTHGITRDRVELRENDGPWYYEMQFLGYNYRMTDIQAALGISQLKKMDRFLEIRRNYANMYNQAFKELEHITVPYQLAHTSSSWHLYIIRLNLEKFTVGRKEIFEALRHENIGVNVHYIPVYLHPYYKNLGYKRGICPRAEALYESMITLPLFPFMKESDVMDVIRAVYKVIGYFSS
jgi:perosamine synthetase